jgi:DNA modification methylase
MPCIDQQHGEHYSLYHGDCVEVIRDIPDNSIHLSVSSWPFSNQYMYSPSIHDFGNCDDDRIFFAQMDYLLPHLLRVTIPGRMAIVHAKDRIVYGTKNDGYACIEPFSDACVQAMRKHGWLYQGRITVATDPVRENAQTNRLGYGEVQKDATRIGFGLPEYGLIFRKPHTKTAKGGTWSDEPVTSCVVEQGYTLPRFQIDENSLWRSDGKRLLLPWEQDGYDYQAHVAYLEMLDERRELGRANGERIPTDHPAVWWDIQRTDVLNARMAKEASDERHIAPLQLDFIRRWIDRESNPGDIVLDYFCGIGSVLVIALERGRRAVGVELKGSYFDTAARYCEETEIRMRQPTLFGADTMERMVV